MRLFERLALEINQAGLSWLTVLKKRKAFRLAYKDFDPAVVARYGARERRRLLSDASIIRNRLKVDAVIENAHRPSCPVFARIESRQPAWMRSSPSRQ